jgi:predicted transcriptional regulator
MTESKDTQDMQSIAEMTTRIVSAYVSHNHIEPDQVPQVIQAVARDLKNLQAGEIDQTPGDVQPAVSPRKSIGKDYLVCLMCGRKQKALKRHLAKAHNMTPEQYRETFGLRPDYPMVAPNTSKRRSEIARSIGLGRREGETEDETEGGSQAA